MKKCKLCPNKTEVVFNINFKMTPICEGCAKSIFLQQAHWYVEQPYPDKAAKNIEAFSANDVDGAYFMGVFNSGGIDRLSDEVNQFKILGQYPHQIVTSAKSKPPGKES